MELRGFKNKWLKVMCDCGNPEEGVATILQVLMMMPLYGNRDRFEAAFPDRGVQHIILGAMDKMGLIEHGGGIGGSWITEEGLAFKEYAMFHKQKDWDD